MQCGTPTRVSQGVAIVGIYPCGKAQKPDRSGAPPRFGSGVPFPLSLDDPGPVLAVKGPLCRFAPWTAPGRSIGATSAIVPFMNQPARQITEPTRRNIAADLSLLSMVPNGRLDWLAFLSRLFELNALPSQDGTP